MAGPSSPASTVSNSASSQFSVSSCHSGSPIDAASDYEAASSAGSSSRNDASGDTAVHHVDLISSFVFPKNFAPHVELGLKNKDMSITATRTFYTTVARAMFVHKRYPSSIEFDAVARLIVGKFPFLKSPIGDGHVRTVLMNYVCMMINKYFFIRVMCLLSSRIVSRISGGQHPLCHSPVQPVFHQDSLHQNVQKQRNSLVRNCQH